MFGAERERLNLIMHAALRRRLLLQGAGHVAHGLPQVYDGIALRIHMGAQTAAAAAQRCQQTVGLDTLCRKSLQRMLPRRCQKGVGPRYRQSLGVLMLCHQ